MTRICWLLLISAFSLAACRVPGAPASPPASNPAAQLAAPPLDDTE